MAYSKKNIIKAIKDAKGIISVAADALGCKRQTVYNHINKDEDVKRAKEEAREKTIDVAENALFNLISNPEHKDHYKAVRYYLTTQGKSRGYNDSNEEFKLLNEKLDKLIPNYFE